MTSTIARAQHADASALRVLKLAANPKPSGAERDRLQKLSGDATSQIKDDAVREAFLRLAGYFRQRERLAEIGQGQAAPVQDLLFIGRFGMVRTAEFAASQLQNELQELPLNKSLAVHRARSSSSHLRNAREEVGTESPKASQPTQNLATVQPLSTGSLGVVSRLK